MRRWPNIGPALIWCYRVLVTCIYYHIKFTGGVSPRIQEVHRTPLITAWQTWPGVCLMTQFNNYTISTITLLNQMAYRTFSLHHDLSCAAFRTTEAVFSYKLRYIVGFWLVEMTISTNQKKWNESGFRPPLCTYRLNWARRTSWGWWDDCDDTVLQTQDSKFEPWRSEAEHATSQSRRLPTILTFTRGWGRNIFVSFKPPRPGTEPRTLVWKAAVLTTTLGPPPSTNQKPTIYRNLYENTAAVLSTARGWCVWQYAEDW